MMRNLALISIFLLCHGCSRSPYLHLQKQEVTPPCLKIIEPEFRKVLYNAHVNVTGKHLSGLLLFKTMPDSSKRVVFTNEMGVTYFDFEFKADHFKVISCIKQMNKKVVINQLKKDIGLLIMHGINLESQEVYTSDKETFFKFVSGKEWIYYITDTACTNISRIETASARKKKVLVNLTGYISGMPDSVYLAHQLFEFNISLKQIQNNVTK